MAGFVLDLPMPVSTNRLWRQGKGGRVYLSPEYKAWKRNADAHFIMQKHDCKPVEGHFIARLVLDSTRRGIDADNASKAVLDALQRWSVIENDKLCDQLIIEWGASPFGCRIFVEPSPDYMRPEARAA